MTVPPGLDLDALRDWLGRERPGLLTGELTADLVAGGKSNLTYRVTDGRRRVIVRRPPLGHVLATAHDMAREARVIAALHDTPVPVPQVYAVCSPGPGNPPGSPESPLGAPFYVMELVDGVPLREASELAPLGPQRTRALALRMVDTLADLHLVDAESVGLGDFGRPQGFLGRQVRRWGQQLDASTSRQLRGADTLRRRLSEGVAAAEASAEGQPATIVHGDFRLDNLLVSLGASGHDGDDDHDGHATEHPDRVTAVLDWEMATLGDPLTDVALLLTYQRLAERGAGGDVSTAPTAAGYPSRTEIAERYAERTGRDLRQLGFYEALACFKLAVILEGIHYRHAQGQTVGEGFASMGAMVEPLLALGLEASDDSARVSRTTPQED